MTDQASILFCCPYCRSSMGDLAINAGKVAIFALDNRHGCEVMLQDCPEQKLVIHNPGSCAQTPCPHLVSFEICVLLSEIRRRGGRTQGKLSLTWRHPWFAEKDLDETVSAFLWHHVVSADVRSGPYYPTSSHQIAHPHCALGGQQGRARSAWVLCVTSAIVVAADSREFLEEIQEIEQVSA